jgi:hypothetical protein
MCGRGASEMGGGRPHKLQHIAADEERAGNVNSRTLKIHKACGVGVFPKC